MDERTPEKLSPLKSILLFSYQIDQSDISETSTRLRLESNDLEHYMWPPERMYFIIAATSIEPCFQSKAKTTIEGYILRSE